MKKIIIITLTLTLINVSVFAHEKEMHQYITREAFDLLKMSFPWGFTGLDEMEAFVGYDQTYNPDNPNVSIGYEYLVSGAWMEDRYDIVYHYGCFDSPNYNNLPPWVEDFFLGTHEKNRKAHTTISHFWDADNGEETSTYLTDTVSGDLGQYTWEFTISENSIKKIRKYFNGSYDQRHMYPDGAYLSGTYPPILATVYDWDIPGIVDTYNGNGELVLVRYLDLIEGWINDPIYYTVSLQNSGKQYAYNRLGRMCHLLQDMSVPAHVHCTAHAGNIETTIFGIPIVIAQHEDYFEEHELDYLENYHAWTASEVYNEFGGFIDPYVHDDPLYFLMYFLNQMTDHYADGKVNGDDNYDSSFPGLSSVISTLGVPILTSEINETNCKLMYDVLIPYAIRVTAGLMYWFAVETNQIDPLPEPVIVSGYVTHSDIGNAPSVLIRFDPQGSGTDKFANCNGEGYFEKTFHYGELGMYDLTYSHDGYYDVPIYNVLINA